MLISYEVFSADGLNYNLPHRMFQHKSSQQDKPYYCQIK